MLSLSEDTQSDFIEVFNSTSRYLDDLSNVDNNFFDSMVTWLFIWLSLVMSLMASFCAVLFPH